MALARLYYDVELPLADVLGEMERIGMPVDAAPSRPSARRFRAASRSWRAGSTRTVGHPFNIGSPKQLGEVLFEELGLPPLSKTKTGYSTDAKVLQQLAIENPIAERIIEYRELTKLKGTYIEGLVEAHRRGRPHPHHPQPDHDRDGPHLQRGRRTCRTSPSGPSSGRASGTPSPPRRDAGSSSRTTRR